MADPREAQFQQDVVDAMAAGGWLTGSPAGYDRARALYTEDVVGYYRAAHPEQWERFCKRNERDPESALLDKVARELDKAGTLDVLRHGFKVPGARVSLCTFKPDHGMNEDTLARYRANRLRVVPEVSYSPHARSGEYNPRLDLVLFVNGIPVATLELKSEFKQAVDRAMRQYRFDRPVRARTNRKPEPLLDKQARAMVVTGSRQEAVRYQLAMRAYIDGKGYREVYPLVAFSGSVPADECIPAEVNETSAELNPGLKGRDHREAFDTGDFNVMIVANKFQTGFDQPRLCAMYVDRRLKGVDCVQTLSRLNRRFPGKDAPFVLDFVNEAEDVRAAFEPYYNTAELTDVSDPDIVFDLQRKLDEARIYEWHEVESFHRAFLDPKATNSTLSYYTSPAVERFSKRYRDVLADLRRWQVEKRRAEESGDRDGRQRAEHEPAEAGERRDALDMFRRDLQGFYRTYEFLAQIVDYDDRELESLCVYARHLHPLLRTERLDEEALDLSELDLTHYRLNKQAEHSIRLGEEKGEYGLDPVSEVGTGKPKDPKTERLAEIIERLNELFGTGVDDRDQLRFADNLADRMSRDEGVVEQIRRHTPEQVMHGRFPRILEQIVLDAMADHEELATRALETDDNLNGLAWAVLRLMAERDRGNLVAGG